MIKTENDIDVALTSTLVNNFSCGFSKRLTSHNLLTEKQAIAAETAAAEHKISLLEYVVDSGMVDAQAAALAAAYEYGLPVINLDDVRINALPPANDLPVKILEQIGALPLVKHEHRLTIAVPFPATLNQLDELKFATGLNIEGVLAPADQLKTALIQYIAQNEPNMLDELEGIDDAVSELNIIHHEGEEEAALDKAFIDGKDAPVVKFVNKILLDAVSRGASDIHFETYESQYRVRFRIDGILVEITRPPFALRHRISARLKIMARLDISERRLPQDGAIKLQLSRTRSIDFRVNSLPTVYGEKVVLRILDPASAQLGIEQLGFSSHQQKVYESALKKPQGMILVTGPTGSGKTVTLYTGINILNQIERNICTAEDPVEIKVAGINQVNVLPKIGLNFASALRAFLRQDPDVVMVGEIRDLETAEIAVKAAQTGHLVLSTVHTNSAAETLARLANMGVATYNIASSVSLIIAQRLARKLCPQCKTSTDIPTEALHKAGFSPQKMRNAIIYKAVGCKQCTLGYKGRIGVYEVVPISDEMRQLIMRDSNAIEIDQQVRKEGHLSLHQSCLNRVLDGSTSLEEVNRISKE